MIKGGIILLFVALSFFVLTGQNLPDFRFTNIDIWPVQTRGHVVQHLLEDHRGFLWITTSSGLYRYDGRQLKSYFSHKDSSSINFNYVEAVFEDSDSCLWFGTSYGVNKYIPQTDNFESVGPPSLMEGRTSSMHQARNGNLWIAAETGLYKYDYVNDTFYRYQPAMWQVIEGYGFRAIAEDPGDSNILWVGGVAGLFRFEIDAAKFEHIPMPRTSPSGLDYMIMCMYLDKSNTLWCGTWGTGAIPFNLNNYKWEEKLFPYPDNKQWNLVVYSILPKDSTAFWISSSIGFGIYNPASILHEFYRRDAKDHSSIGISSLSVGLVKTRQGPIIVSRTTGFSIAYERGNTIASLKFPPLIHNINVHGKSIFSDTAYANLKYIYLDENEKDITITFSTPGNYSESPVTYAYRLNGYDREWQMMNTGNEVRYTNIPRGQYQFYYKAKLEGQEWISGNSIRITKEVALTQRPAFLIGLVLLLAVLLLAAYLFRIKHIRTEEQLKTKFNKKLANMEMAALRAQMNPHFMFNSLNSIKYYILNQESDNANKYLTKFSKLMRSVLKNSNSKLVPISDELDALALYVELESLRFTEDFKYELVVDETIDKNDVFIPPLIIQPYVENAIWHGLLQKNRPGKLIVTLEINEAHLSIHIKDDGIGRAAANKLGSKSAVRKSFGTKITKDRIALIKETLGIDATVKISDLEDQNGDASGTLVVIRIPLITGSDIEMMHIDSNSAK